jgi:type IV pilus assembly protein PilM
MGNQDETSIWKKEISFRRKPKPEPAVEAPTPKADETSIWKKEISFRRKPKPAPAIEPARPKPQPAAESPNAPPVAQPSVPLPVAPPPHSDVPPDPVVMPPVTAPAAAPQPAATHPPAAQPAHAPVAPPVTAPTAQPPAPQPPAAPPVVPVSVPEAHEPASDAAPADPVPPHPAPAAAAAAAAVAAHDPVTVSLPEEPPAPSRQGRREAKKAADQLAKKQKQRSKELAKEERKSSRRKHKRVVGLKIGASQIAAAHVVNNGGPRLLGAARAAIPHGIVVGGELREPEQLAGALKTLFRKNKLPQTCVRLGIANNRIGVRTFEITGVEDDGQLANAVRFRAQEALPIPLDEAVLDYRILEDRVGENGVRVCRVLLVVAHRELVERYVAACKKAGLKLIGIDLEAFGLLRALADPAGPPAEDAAVVCIAIGHDRSTLAVSDGRVCEFTRVIAWGGSDLDVALARTLDLTPGAAEPLKRELVLGAAGESAGLDAQEADAARAAMVNELRTFARELVGSLRFYQEQPNSLGISEILITGGASAGAGLAEELERLIGIPVRIADPLTRVKVSRKVRNLNGSVGSLAVAVGLGIED